MPRVRQLPQQLLADILAELRGVNERLDRLGPQAYVPADPPAGDVSAPVRLEEPVRRSSLPQPDPDFPDADRREDEAGELPDEEALLRDPGREENARDGRCQELTSRGSVCGRRLPCRYHG